MIRIAAGHARYEAYRKVLRRTMEQPFCSCCLARLLWRAFHSATNADA